MRRLALGILPWALEDTMKAKIHPEYHDVTVVCACGNSFPTRSTKKDLRVEIRIRTELQHRVLYLARFKDFVCVIHAFEKKSRKSSKRDLDLARHRLRLFEAGDLS